MELQSIQRSPLLQPLFDFLFPPLCLGCGKFDSDHSHICERCEQAIDRVVEPLCLNCLQPLSPEGRCETCREHALPLFVWGRYREPLDEIIRQFKFKGITAPARIFGALLAAEYGYRLHALAPDRLIPVSLHPARENQRGYNQAALLAREISAALDIPVDEGSLWRVKRRKPQAQLGMTERVANIRGVFRAEAPATGRSRVALVDDVVTSGVTVLQAKETLEQVGHRVVGIVAIAHGG